MDAARDVAYILLRLIISLHFLIFKSNQIVSVVSHGSMHLCLYVCDCLQICIDENGKSFKMSLHCNVPHEDGNIKYDLFLLDIRVRDCGGGYSNHGYQVQDVHTRST